jgi:hypothetical protein
MRLFSHLLALTLLAGCAATPAASSSHPEAPMPPPTAPTPPPAARTFVLGVGDTATLEDGSHLSYLRLVNDSRCPPGVQCIWAGDAEIALRWQPAHGPAQDASLHTNPLPERGSTDAILGTWRIRLESLERGVAPKATLRVTRAGG